MGAKYRDIVQEHSNAKRSARAVLNVLANYANSDGIAHPGDERIAADAGVSTRTVRRQIQALVDLGEIQVLEGGNGRGNKREIYITLGNKTGQVDHFVGEEKPDSLSLKPDKLTDKTGQSVTIKPDKLTSSLYIEPTAEPTAEPQQQPRASLAAANGGLDRELEEIMHRLQPKSDLHSDLPPGTEEKELKQAFQKIVGRTLRHGDNERLLAMEARSSRPLLIRAMHRTAENAKRTRIHDAVAYTDRMLSVLLEEETNHATHRRGSTFGVTQEREADLTHGCEVTAEWVAELRASQRAMGI